MNEKKEKPRVQQTENNERWRRVNFDGVPDDYILEISDTGRLRRFVPRKNTWRELKASYMKGYLIYSFKFDKSYTKLIHRLVAEAFVEKEHASQEYVIHLDFNKENNHYSNLRWVTKDTMFAHQKINPNYVTARGRVTNSKLSEADVIRLKKKLKRGKTKLYKIAKEFGITHTQLNRIRSGENWGHIVVE